MKGCSLDLLREIVSVNCRSKWEIMFGSGFSYRVVQYKNIVCSTYSLGLSVVGLADGDQVGVLVDGPNDG